MRNCLIMGNQQGPGIWINVSSTNALISGCTIVSNYYGASYGAGIRVQSPSGTIISSCIICSNTASYGVYNDVYDNVSPANINAIIYSCLGTNPGFTGAGIITGNPGFVDFAGGNYRLAANSPCINTGSNEDWMTGAVDLDGRPRI